MGAEMQMRPCFDDASSAPHRATDACQVLTHACCINVPSQFGKHWPVQEAHLVSLGQYNVLAMPPAPLHELREVTLREGRHVGLVFLEIIYGTGVCHNVLHGATKVLMLAPLPLSKRPQSTEGTVWEAWCSTTDTERHCSACGWWLSLTCALIASRRKLRCARAAGRHIKRLVTVERHAEGCQGEERLLHEGRHTWQRHREAARRQLIRVQPGVFGIPACA